MSYSGNRSKNFLALLVVGGLFSFLAARVSYAGTSCTLSPNGATFTSSVSCTFDGTVDGVDYGAGTTNTSVLNINAGSVTIGANQTIALGSVSLTGGSLVIIGGGKMLLNTPLWYTDPDGDGSYDTTLNASKTQDLHAVRKNSIATPASFDCNPGSSLVSISHTQCYTDADGDGYTNGLAANTTCLNSSSCATATQASASTNGAAVTAYTAGRLRDAATATDCGDGNAQAHPGQGSYVAGTFTNTVTGLAGDWNCDGTVVQQYPSTYVCSVTGCASHYFTIANGWATSVPACGVSGTWQTYAGAVAGTCTTNIAGAGTTCPGTTPSTVTQACL